MKDKILGLLRKSNTSYKYFFLLACIDSIVKSTRQYKFDYLGKYMIAEAIQNGDFAYKRYTQNDRLYDVVIYLYGKDSSFSVLTDINLIYDKITENLDDYVSKMINQLTQYVPYRLIITDDLATEISRLNDWEKNKRIEELSHDYETIYIISGKSIIWREEFFNYILSNKEDLKREIIKIIQDKFIGK